MSLMVCPSVLLARVDVRSRKWEGPRCIFSSTSGASSVHRTVHFILQVFSPWIQHLFLVICSIRRHEVTSGAAGHVNAVKKWWSVQLLQPIQVVAPFATTTAAQTRMWSSSTSSSRGLRASPLMYAYTKSAYLKG
ncbi:hypothetical protein VPH35_051737 [Triticum aestivum]